MSKEVYFTCVMLEDLKQEVNEGTGNKTLSSDKKKLRAIGPGNTKVEAAKGFAQGYRERSP